MNTRTERHLAALAGRDAFMKAMGIEVVEARVGRVVVAMTVNGGHLNFNGTCHGGVIFSLADAAFGLASNAHGSISAGINAQITYPSAAREGDRLVAAATEIARSSRLGSYRVEVVKEDGNVVASFMGTVFVTDRNHEGIA